MSRKAIEKVESTTKVAALAVLAVVVMGVSFVGVVYLLMPEPAGLGHPLLTMVWIGLVGLAIKGAWLSDQ